MANTNYNKMSKPKTEEAKPVVNSTIAPVEEVVKEEPKQVTGVIAYCVRLNVRKKPSIKAEVLTTVNVDTEVLIDLEKSTDGWYKLVDHNGFCMKEYVKLVPKEA